MARSKESVTLPTTAQLSALGDAVMGARLALTNTRRGLEILRTNTDDEQRVLVVTLIRDIDAALAPWEASRG